jgi:parallel beta-helix repeat protein
VRFASHFYRITGNQANDTVPFGIEVGGSGNIVVSNTTIGNNLGGDGDGWGIFIVPIGFPSPVENNLIMNNSSSNNEVDDGYDSNPQCGTDRWVLNDLTTGNQPCVR